MNACTAVLRESVCDSVLLDSRSNTIYLSEYEADMPKDVLKAAVSQAVLEKCVLPCHPMRIRCCLPAIYD